MVPVTVTSPVLVGHLGTVAASAVGPVVTMNAVWMHLDEAERRQGLPNVASLLRPRGILAMTLRYGPVPPGRRMFEVSTVETTALAAEAGLELLLDEDAPTLIQRAVPVTWKRLVFRQR